MNGRLNFEDLVAAGFPWSEWEDLIHTTGITVERPVGSAHPRYPEIIYPIDYGFVAGTVGSDGEPVDVFMGTAGTGLVGALLTTDYRRGDREAKLLFDCSPEEIYLANGFINFDRRLMEGVLVLRRSMGAIREAAARARLGKGMSGPAY